jgi:hypothetical protein
MQIINIVAISAITALVMHPHRIASPTAAPSLQVNEAAGAGLVGEQVLNAAVFVHEVGAWEPHNLGPPLQGVPADHAPAFSHIYTLLSPGSSNLHSPILSSSSGLSPPSL